MAYGNMSSYDVASILQNYTEEKQDIKIEDITKKTRAEDLVTEYSGDKALESAIRKSMGGNNNAENTQRKAEKIEQDRKNYDAEFGEHSYDIDGYDAQRYLIDNFMNTLNVKNAQRVILMNNRDNIRKGLSKEAAAHALTANNRMIGKGQTSTITIPTQLLRYVQQEIGGLTIKATQNDIMTGFLYWYFGKPEDVIFNSQETEQKMIEILDNLDINASPARVSKVSHNTANATLDKLDTMAHQVDTLLKIISDIAKDSMALKVQSDKTYIALCYNILNMLAFTPPIMPGERPDDVDILANGEAWELMKGVDVAYDYYKSKNGREIYKSKIRKKVNAFNYAPPTTVEYGENYNDNDYYNGDDDYGYDEVEMDDYGFRTTYIINDEDAIDNDDE